MNTRDFEIITKRFNLEFGFDVLKRTRKREVIEARATLIMYLKKYRGCGLVQIARLIESHTGWNINHATVYHSIELYDTYTFYNPKLDEVMRSVIGHFEKDSDKQQYIKNTITRLPSSVLSDIHKTVEQEYSKVLESQLQKIE